MKYKEEEEEEEEDPDHNSANLTEKHLPKPLNHTKLKTHKQKIKKKKKTYTTKENKKNPETKKDLTGKEELVGRIKPEPPPSRKQRLGHRGNRIRRMQT